MEELIGDEALVSFVELEQFIGKSDSLCFGFFTLRDILKGYHCIRNVVLFIINWRTPNLDRNNLVALVNFHIIYSGTFAAQRPRSWQFGRGIFLLCSCLIELINLWYLLAGDFRKNSFTQ